MCVQESEDNNERIFCAYSKWNENQMVKSAGTLRAENNVKTFIFMCQLYVSVWCTSVCALINVFVISTP